jgi:hypothetical protein
VSLREEMRKANVDLTPAGYTTLMTAYSQVCHYHHIAHTCCTVYTAACVSACLQSAHCSTWYINECLMCASSMLYGVIVIDQGLSMQYVFVASV